ncbi:hypothetical protein UFOVP1537_4 [uncultured Caudovirales phage]|uniref:Uncharacterized protein n=2 Tax=root TaxID=1 RepID=A0A6J5P7X6_9CAUD|nr:hypothetical protein UFOVP825_22 [uncultured Caudovirales phage]CAB4171171.1 hypothetical protein UFOVP915_4 [uncultured Caudovirales phage]CAB4177204.1 hypothetical protein UFOVP1000_21 [uncultured Caudovirales phage]CAB4183311.1 hypothetical protein UFOVP1092_49 [uncultured Caudovirales phage]CAB4187730.1 hypothetical protein UFOVP1152_53 [uncultured Caudovirales phage]
MTGPNAVSIDEMETANAAPAATTAAPTINEIKLDQAGVPEHLRGKTLADVLERTERMEQALRLSEDARLSLSRNTNAVAVPVQQPTVPVLTDDQFNTLLQENPAEALRYRDEQMASRMLAHLESRLAPLNNAGFSSQKEAAKAKYPLEFAMFADQLDQVANGLPDKSALSTPQGWEQLVSFVRGMPDNFEKLMTARTSSTGNNSAAEARRAEELRAGFSVSSGAGNPAPITTRGASVLDDTQKRVAATMGISEADYVKWMNVGN